MAFIGFGASELLLLLLMSGAGQSNDLVGVLPPHDYFKTRGIEISIDKMVELAGTDPADAKTQIAQLLALRQLSADADKLKRSDSYAEHRKLIEQIATGKKAQDKQGFSREYAARLLARLDGAALPAANMLVPSRQETLAMFPSTCTFVGVLERWPGPAGAKDPGLKQMHTLLARVPKEAKQQVYDVLEKLGNAQVGRIAFGYDEKNKTNYFRMTGKANHAWVAAALADTKMEQKERKSSLKIPITLFIPERNGPTIALLGDGDLLIAGHERNQDNGLDTVLKALEQYEKKEASAATGPLKEQLQKIPDKAIGYLVGAFPDEFRRELTRGGPLGGPFGAFPKSIVAHLQRAPTGFDLQLDAALDNRDEAKSFVESVSNLRQDGLDGLKNLQGLPLPVQVNLDPLQDVLNSLQIEGNGAGARMRVLVSDAALETFSAMMAGFAQGLPDMEDPPAQKK